MNQNTLYVNNLNDKINKNDLRTALYMLFSTYGTVVDIVALKTPKMRGQAHVVFFDPSAAAIAMKALKNFIFFGKEMKIQYAHSKSKIIERIVAENDSRGPLKRLRDEADLE
ncbi:U2 snRNP-associated protein Msl1 [Schizosaccharomyces pombe]|uniref:Probable U2 small nuclear ribonucleoprotein B'' n=1 Tax=Schizosaccharomyces pombe (strain 972 / ATCC 24843) TaxID=284812 RepID=RU2B_SCHPO|nr:putative U2 snRNP-associated protein Msl1 [Schizosaccharomyces pombe]Q7LL14.1 RecName: Full=Probable U2 small nuclear ribonucleoprotein B''; Short=U2 snRNP B'' [Schizosaccharomyces pombe 972h-]3JB9_k Chain k, Probable U2 small nuclear ribonucleoprotein B'' [Schizosaccharomyces pombe 972h-]CAA17824.1 U2 snRNP-associated protein Msl1 (predicted) [Schizosaccharomyces pombe]|eukprot:NP_595571.1 putative U2 snRNP-associated protein Msl1 [Schizosaccharomyces pombe]